MFIYMTVKCFMCIPAISFFFRVYIDCIMYTIICILKSFLNRQFVKFFFLYACVFVLGGVRESVLLRYDVEHTSIRRSINLASETSHKRKRALFVFVSSSLLCPFGCELFYVPDTHTDAHASGTSNNANACEKESTLCDTIQSSNATENLPGSV